MPIFFFRVLCRLLTSHSKLYSVLLKKKKHLHVCETSPVKNTFFPSYTCRIYFGCFRRWTPLALAKHFPLSGRVRDLHPLEYTHAGRTKNAAKGKDSLRGISAIPLLLFVLQNVTDHIFQITQHTVAAGAGGTRT